MNLAEDYFSKKYFSEEIFSENFEDFETNGQTLFFDRVFRRHHASSDPVNRIDSTGYNVEIIQQDGGWGHQIVHIFDPANPGNDVYVDFMPAQTIQLPSGLFTTTPGYVNITSQRPEGHVLDGSLRVTTAEQDEKLLLMAQADQLKAKNGQLVYNPLLFTQIQVGTKTVTNCQGFASGF